MTFPLPLAPGGRRGQDELVPFAADGQAGTFSQPKLFPHCLGRSRLAPLRYMRLKPGSPRAIFYGKIACGSRSMVRTEKAVLASIQAVGESARWGHLCVPFPSHFRARNWGATACWILP
jgi:hypothetical protein